MRASLGPVLLLLLLPALALAGDGRDRELAKFLAREGRIPEAIDTARKAVTEDPGDAAAGRILQELLLSSGQDPAGAIPAGAPEGVQAYLKARILPAGDAERALTAIREQPDCPREVALDLARAWIALGKVRTAEAALREYTEAWPEEAEGFYLLGVARSEMGSEASARSALERALQIEPGAAPPTLLLAKLYRERQEPGKGHECLMAGLKLYPDNPELHFGLGVHQIDEGDASSAVESMKKAASLRPEEPRYLAGLVDAYLVMKRYAEAEEVVRKSLELRPADTAAMRKLGLVLEKKGEWDAALEIYKGAAKLEPDWARIHVDLGFVYTVLGRLDDAEKELKLALKLDKDEIDATVNLGVVAYHRKDMKEAKGLFGQALRGDPGHVTANLFMGYVFLAEGKAKDAIKAFEKVADLDPASAEPHRMIGRALLSMGKVDEAMDAFVAAIDCDPEDPWAHFDLGKGHEEKGEWDQAETAYRRAIELDPKFTHPHLYLAELLDEVQDKPKDAVEHYQAYLDLGGPDPYGDVRERVKQLDKK